MKASLPESPQSRIAAYAPGCTNAAIRLKSAGRSCCHQRILGPWLKLGGPPVLRMISGPASASILSIMPLQRVSSHES